MKDTVRAKLDRTAARFEELGALLSDAATVSDPARSRDLSREYAHLEPVMGIWQDWLRVEAEIAAAQGMMDDPDASVRNMAGEELRTARERASALERELELAMLPHDPDDDADIYLEIRAAAGGDEAALFAGDLFRMYARYAERQGWKTEIMNASEGEHGGYREVIVRILGTGAHARLKFESGAHRVQRVPATESQGRIHTSTCTVVVMPVPDEVAPVDINPSDLRVDTYRASGAGGQHVNKTDSAVRLTHLPTGIVVECQDERSQHKNRARAMSLMAAKLLAAAREKQETAHAQTRKSLVGTGDRSERIRTYNFPQGRLTDHRIGLTLYQLDDVMAGDMDPVVQALVTEHQAELLATL